MNEKQEPLYLVRSDIPPILSICFFKWINKQTLLCGTESGAVYMWDLETSKPDKDPLFKSSDSPCIGIATFEEMIFSQNKMGCVKIWSHKESGWTEEYELNSHYLGFCKIAVSEYMGGTIIFPDSESLLNIYDVKNRLKICTLKPESEENIKYGQIMACKLIYNNNSVPYVLAAYENEMLCLWDLGKQQIISKYKLGSVPTSIDFDNDKSQGLCGTVSKKILLFSLDDCDNITVDTYIPSKMSGVSCVKIQSHANVAVLSFWNKSLQFLCWSDKHAYSLKKVHYDVIQDISFSPWPVPLFESKCLMAAASKNSQISLWCVE